MKIIDNSSLDRCDITIDETEKSSWRDGMAVYRKMPRDSCRLVNEQPVHLGIPEHFGNGMETVYVLEALARRYPEQSLLQEKMQKVIIVARKLAVLYNDYMNHALGVCLDPLDTEE